MLEKNRERLEIEMAQRLGKRMGNLINQEFNRHQMSLTTQRLVKEKEDSHKMDPKPIKRKPKKNTYGRGWHGDDDGRATL